MRKIDRIVEKYLSEGSKLPPQGVYDKVRKLRKAGKSDEQISKLLKITLNTVQGIQEASGAGTSYESMWNQWWSRPYMILIRDGMVLHSNDPLYPTGSAMSEDDRQKASMKGYTILDW